MGGWHPTPNPDVFRNREIGEAYRDLRLACARLEELIGGDAHGLTPKGLKRADKAVTIMKAGFKILKKAARRPKRTPSQIAAARLIKIADGRNYAVAAEENRVGW